MRRALLLAVALAFAEPGVSSATVLVRLAPEAVVHGDDIVLSDVADIEGDGPLAGRLRTLRIAPAPLPGSALRIEGDVVRAWLHSVQADPPRVQLNGAPRVVVTRAFQTVRAADLIDAVRQHARPRLEGASMRGEPLGLTPISRPEDLKVPTGEVRLDPRLHEQVPGAPTLAATVTVRVNGRDYQRVTLTFQITRLVMVAVVARPLEPRRAISAEDFRLEQRSSSDVPPDALTEIAEPSDLEVLRPLQPGEVLTPRVIRPRITVKRGELVTLLLEGAGFRITTQGQAAEDARRGDTVRVVNVASKREVVGRVESAGVVRVPYRTLGSE